MGGVGVELTDRVSVEGKRVFGGVEKVEAVVFGVGSIGDGVDDFGFVGTNRWIDGAA